MTKEKTFHLRQEELCVENSEDGDDDDEDKDADDDCEDNGWR